MRTRRLIMSLLALALVTSAFAVALTPAGADTPKYSGTEWVFFPWVPNGETLDGTGPWYGTVTIQNLEDETIVVNTHQTAGGSSNFTTTISPNASKTLPAATLGVGDPGGPLAISAVFRTPQYLIVEGEESDIPVPPKIGAVMKQVSPSPSPSGAGTTDAHNSVDGHTAIPAQDIAWGPESAFCRDIGGTVEGDEFCNNVGAYNFGVPEGGFDGHSYLPIVQTNDGWNSAIHVSNIDASSPAAAAVTLKFFSTDQQGAFSSELHGIEYTEFLNPGETWTFNLKDMNFPDDWVGSAWIVSDYAMSASVNRVKEETGMVISNTAAPSVDAITSIDGLGDWTENAYALSEGDAEVADVGGDDATAEFLETHIDDGTFEMYGPLVFRHYNGWNTGISVVNITEQTNDVDIKFYGSGGAVVFEDSLTISPKGQDFVYIPNDPDLVGDEGFVGSVLLSSQRKFHASIDQVKYTTGEAMSYIATAAGARDVTGQEIPGLEQSLSLPLIQKGSTITGLGDTSGVQLFNIDRDEPVKVAIEFFNQSGNLAQPTLNEPITMTLQPYQNANLYTMKMSSMLQNFSGSAVITPIDGGGEVVGVSNNVNYNVQSDGSAAFNMLNTMGQFRLPKSQTQLEAESIVLEPGDGEEQVGTDYTLTATVLDQYGQPLPNVHVDFDVSDDGTPEPVSGSGWTNVDGQVQFTYTNEDEVLDVVTAGVVSTSITDTATVDWISVPPQLTLDAGDVDQTEPGTGGDIVSSVTNPVTAEGGITYDPVRFRITVEGPGECAASDTWTDDGWWITTHVNYVDGDGGIEGTFECEDGKFVGYWGPPNGFPMPDGFGETTTFTIDTAGTDTGIYTITTDLMHWDSDEGEVIGDPIATATDSFAIVPPEGE